MWAGWMSLAGNEIINARRTAVYANALGLGWFTACDDCPNLAPALGDDPYQSVLTDQPGWFDPDNPDTWAFAGFYPLDITGVDDSTRTAVVTESLLDGGVIGPVRHAARVIVISGLMLGADECAVQAGMSWLRAALLGSNCREDPHCVGDELCFLSCCPPIDECDVGGDPPHFIDSPNYPGHCLDDFIRHFFRSVVTEGPTITARHAPSTGGCAWEIQFTITCGTPWAFGNSIVVYDDEKPPSDPPHIITDEPNCNDAAPDGTLDYRDPFCPRVPRAPTVPEVALQCYSIPNEWARYAFPVPATAVRTWQDSVVHMELETKDDDIGVSNLRMRWYSDPLGWGHMSSDPDCGFCGEFYILYIPPNASFVLDGRTEQVTVQIGDGRKRNARAVCMATDGGPIEWPLISCGHAYMLTFDVDHQADPQPWQRLKRFSVSLQPRGV
jgi:hypothetical protein